MLHLTTLQKFTGTIVTWVFVLAALSYAFFYISDRIAQTRLELAQIESNIIQIEIDRRLALVTEQTLKNHTQDVERMRNFFVDRHAPIAFIERIEDIARQTENTISLLAEEGKSNAETLYFRVTVSGTDTSVRNMLRMIIALPFDISIDSVAYERAGTDGSDPTGVRLIISFHVKTL